MGGVNTRTKRDSGQEAKSRSGKGEGNTDSIVVKPGAPLHLGLYIPDDGHTFALFSRHATRVQLLLFESAHSSHPCLTIELDPELHKTGDVWHVWLRPIPRGSAYAFRVDGPYYPAEGHRFNRHKLLLDPYARALIGTDLWDFNPARGFDAGSALEDLSFSAEDNIHRSAKCLIFNSEFDWEGDVPPVLSWEDTIIYETHVRGLTVHPSSGVKAPGTFLGLIEQIPYFKELGITAVELMPVQEFNSNELVTINPFTGERLRNYWGYNTVSFFAPKESYAGGSEPGCQVTEFKTMVKELHRAGIEVILDIALNHTAEGSQFGPTLNFRGLDNKIYYLLDSNPRFYKDFSGCGNTMNCNHPVVRDYILDCLRYWVVEMHIDGFRFDLASVLGRDENGDILLNPPLLRRIYEDPILRGTKLIAEAWDAGGAYQVGTFPGIRCSEWNGRYRDEVRRFWRGDPGMVGALAARICGSADLYERFGKEPLNSINFITCHDGFTLNDLVSYRYKHNEANGEDNRDGMDENYSDHYGMEGETDDPVIEAVRLRQIKNMLATLFVSRGIPMLLGGDEFRRTQQGNNNAYCQDNEISWYDWNLFQRHNEVFRFTREMIAFRKRHKVLRVQKFYTDRDIFWFDHYGEVPDWQGPGCTLGCLVIPEKCQSEITDRLLCLLFNAESFEVDFALPAITGGIWRVAVDTANPCPADIFEEGREEFPDRQEQYRLQPRSMVILLSDESR